MYRNSRNNSGFRGRSFGRSHGNGGRANPRFSHGFKKHGAKKLDERLFINKPIDASSESTQREILHTFQDFNIAPVLKTNIVSKQYATPTPIQDQAIPVILEGRDVIGIANTGTGKTAAFLIPLINKAFLNRSERILIVVPTRELATQINDELRSFTKGMIIYSVLLIGGASMSRQRHELQRGFNFVIGTPGRIKDMLRVRALNLSIVHNVVLDEVDRMVDIGFIRDIEYLISLLPQDRQSLFFSATVNGKVDQILRTFVKDPVTISVKTHDAAATVEQNIVKITDKSKKIDILHDLLIKEGFEKVLIFGRTKWGVQKLSVALTDRGFKTAAIHGNKTQGQRLRALSAFKNNEVPILLATDVASRGIDVEDITHVINYDAPESYDDYVHRIGRTGRANKKGKAITFVE